MIKTLLFILLTLPLFAQQDTTWNSKPERPDWLIPFDSIPKDNIPLITSDNIKEIYPDGIPGTSFTTELYSTIDTLVVEGLGLYLLEEEWQYGTTLELVPTRKKVVYEDWNSGYVSFGKIRAPYYTETLEVWQYVWDNMGYEQKWIQLDMKQWTEVLFIQKK